eukprot:1045026-Prymnesium_polylepis.1
MWLGHTHAPGTQAIVWIQQGWVGGPVSVHSHALGTCAGLGWAAGQSVSLSPARCTLHVPHPAVAQLARDSRACRPAATGHRIAPDNDIQRVRVRGECARPGLRRRVQRDRPASRGVRGCRVVEPHRWRRVEELKMVPAPDRLRQRRRYGRRGRREAGHTAHSHSRKHERPELLAIAKIFGARRLEMLLWGAHKVALP